VPGGAVPGDDVLVGAVVLEANVDDLDPRLWPVVLDRLLAAGAWDAWLSPILMKKGRPAHTVHVLGAPDDADTLEGVVFTETTTLGVRRVPVTRSALERAWVEIDVGLDDARVRIKVGHRAGRLVVVMPEFDDVVATAATVGVPTGDLLARAHAAAARAGLVPGAAWSAEPPGAG
jgi:pyridinium-3,5-bisthiocarboxylic acid mononucleotide nickel chelatase